MATPTDIQNTLLTARLKLANLVDANVISLQGGILSVKWGIIRNGTRAVNSVARQFNLGDYVSKRFLNAYSCLSDFVGIYGAGAIDPNAQIPGQAIITVPVLQNWNNGQIPINTTTGSPQFLISNYNLIYKGLYGNHPVLAPYITAGGFDIGDEQTPPIITRATPGDSSSDILSILYDYPIATVGYLNIYGSGGTFNGNVVNPGSNQVPPTPSDQSFIIV